MIVRPGQRWLHLAVILLATVGLCWPAIWNGYPLLAPDVMAYLGDGVRVWKALLGHGDPWFTPGRPEAYSAAIYLVDWGRSAWPAVVLQAVLTAWVLWLVMRMMAYRRPVLVYCVVVAALCAGSSVAWTVSWPMPDILGPLLYLSVAMLVFVPEKLSRREQWGLVVLGAWCIASHPSHLIIAVCLCGFLGLLWLLRWRAVGGMGVVMLAGMIMVAAALQIAIHARILGKATLNGPRPPYLMARAIADGPARDYLRAHCGELDWLICKSQDKLTDNLDQFLWLPGAVWLDADVKQQEELRREEMPLVMGTLRAYPKQQAKRSLRNAEDQLLSYRIDVFPGRPWLEQRVPAVIPDGASVYGRTKQFRDAMPVGRADSLAYALIPISLIVVAALAWSVRRDRWLVGLSVVIAFITLLNPAVTGVLSGITARYQSRVLWLVPMLALLMVARVLDQRMGRSGSYSASSS